MSQLAQIQGIPKKVIEYLTQTFLKSGKLGYTKLAFASLLAFWGLNFLARQHGLLSKKSVKGSHIFITGAGSGLGKQMAILFARLGAKVSLTDINLQSVEAVESLIKAEGLQSKAIYCDVANVQSVKDAAKVARETFGDVEILINNAGIVSGKKLLETTEKMIEKTLQVNTISHAYTVREFLPAMLQNNKGHIVTIASAAGTVGVCGLADYCASKFGAFGFDESLRMELKQLKSNVRTTCICPYYINTGMFDGVQSKYEFLLPILQESYVSKRIVNAVLQNERVVVLPALTNAIFLSRAIFPVWLFDHLCNFLGINQTMDHFVGRTNPSQTAV